jgi:hypothetical protein
VHYPSVITFFKHSPVARTYIVLSIAHILCDVRLVTYFNNLRTSYTISEKSQKVLKG